MFLDHASSMHHRLKQLGQI